MKIKAGRLSKSDRDALPPEFFAVPTKRKLPLNDERHTVLAWDMVDKTQGLTTDEKADARRRILARAEELGIDTKDWNKIRAMSMMAMSLNIAHDDDHPNKMPFSGVLTKLDEPSDGAPGGANGKRIIVSSDAARAATGTLLGMAVDFTPHFDGHDVKAKIGIITSADVVGNEIRISGFVYAADFPEIADLIQDMKDLLGFSFEAQRLRVEDMSAEILRITELTFTGAAILRKEKAAYQSTSLAASADTQEDLDMTAEELKAILAEAIKPISDRLEKVENDTKAVAGTMAAAAELRAKVEPHAVALETAATAMEAAGIKADHLRAAADAMRAEAAAGRMPKALGVVAPAVATALVTADDVNAKIAAAVAEAVEPLNNKLAAAETKLADATAAGRLQAAGPVRKTLEPAVMASLARAGLTMPEGDAKLKIADVDKALQASGLDLTRRIMVKSQLERVGVLSA